MQKIHFRMTSEGAKQYGRYSKIEKRAYLVRLEDDNGTGWFTYTIWDSVNKRWVKPLKNMPKLIHERAYDVVNGTTFNVRSLDFTNKIDFGWIQEHNILYPFFESKE